MNILSAASRVSNFTDCYKKKSLMHLYYLNVNWAFRAIFIRGTKRALCVFCDHMIVGNIKNCVTQGNWYIKSLFTEFSGFVAANHKYTKISLNSDYNHSKHIWDSLHVK